MSNRFKLLATAALALAVFGPAHAAPEHPVKNIVLVHGAFADGSGWKVVSDILTKDGYSVSIAQPPERVATGASSCGTEKPSPRRIALARDSIS